MSVLSERLKQLRGASSQTEMASALGMKYQQWARYEKGDVVPSAEVIANICRVHACSADWLLGLKDSATSAAMAVPGSAPVCSKCPFKKKLARLASALAE